MINAKRGIPTCPVGCMYCMAQKIDIRLDYWKDVSRIGMNKSCTFFNRLPQDPPLSQMNLPWNLLEGEYLGFQGITDCFWDIFKEDLKYIVEKVKNSNIRKLCLISKIPIDDEQINILLPIKEKLIICYSITGLNDLEKTTSEERIDSLVKIRSFGIDAFPVIHPYIHGYCDIEKIMRLLNKNNFKDVNWKGFRYNQNNMKVLEKYIKKDILEQYIGNGKEEEILIGDDYLNRLANKYKIKEANIKEYLHKEDKYNKLIVNCEQQEYIKKIKIQVGELAKQCVFSTSAKKTDVIENCINRRIANVEFNI